MAARTCRIDRLVATVAFVNGFADDPPPPCPAPVGYRVLFQNGEHADGLTVETVAEVCDEHVPPASRMAGFVRESRLRPRT